MKLKTLNDILGEIIITRDDCEACKVLEEKIFKLKAEAIKWVKEYSEGFFNSSDEHANVAHWIMHFFNITEDDLK